MNIRDNRSIVSGETFYDRIVEGVDAIADAVKVTLGPKGRNVLLEKKYGLPDITKDGVSVAREIFLEDSVANGAAQELKHVAVKTNEVSGDGTTTALVLAQSIFHAGLDLIRRKEQPCSPVVVKDYFERATAAVVDWLKKKSRSVKGEELRHVARISANSNELGDLVYGILAEDPKRVVIVEESNLIEHEVSEVNGLRIENGYITPYFVTNPDKMESSLENVAVMLVDGKITNAMDLLPSMELLASNKVGNLLVVADGVDAEVLHMMVVNHVKGNFKSVAVKAPNWGKVKSETLRDIAIVTGGRVFGVEGGGELQNPTLEDFGSAKKVLTKEMECIITGGGGDEKEIKRRLAEVQEKYDKSDSQFDKSTYSTRLSKLGGGVTILKVGGKSEPEMKEKMDRIEDAIQAVVAAADGGVLPGGGNALFAAAEAIGKETNDDITDFFLGALKAPFFQILENASLEWDEKPVKFNVGIDVKMNAATPNLMKSGVIDPTKVTITALESASSVACTLLMSSVAVTYVAKGDKRTEASDLDI